MAWMTGWKHYCRSGSNCAKTAGGSMGLVPAGARAPLTGGRV